MDKVNDKSFKSNLSDIAQENSFYSIPEIERSAIEKALGRLEQVYFRNPYFELIRLKNFAKFPLKLKKNFFIFLAVQLMRTNETRLKMKEMHEQTLMVLAKDYGINIPDGVQVRIKREHAKAEHLLYISNMDAIFEHTKFLFNKKWVTCLNKTKIPLWTSDSPISYYNNFNDQGNLGTFSPGIEIRFPLTQSLLLFSYDPNVHAPVNNKDKLPAEKIVLSNETQIRSSIRFIFSPVDDFEIARQYLKKNPEYRDPDRRRWRIISDRHKIEFIKI